ncbi:UNVERIFIED_CONTAM: hypothetical protein PYX00_007529 [Menopon gallinae]|uniref:Uncharacterized protein n=1 Tax=Menopon gallinae TaxID=328185 RepID=A0AAW2HJC3_9NEOP
MNGLRSRTADEVSSPDCATEADRAVPYLLTACNDTLTTYLDPEERYHFMARGKEVCLRRQCRSGFMAHHLEECKDKAIVMDFNKYEMDPSENVGGAILREAHAESSGDV